MKLVKLIRDNLGTDEDRLVYASIDPEQHLELLQRKVRDEAIEFADDPCIEELADVFQAAFDAMVLMDWSFEEVNRVRVKKLDERGGFTLGRGMFIEPGALRKKTHKEVWDDVRKAMDARDYLGQVLDSTLLSDAITTATRVLQSYTALGTISEVPLLEVRVIENFGLALYVRGEQEPRWTT